jgi:NodT family efflux transporter outer membrane factor (OMF) lipoprotein
MPPSPPISDWIARDKRASWAALWLLVLLVTSGCKVGPDYREPAVAINESWIDASHAQFRGAPEDSLVWWTCFEDPVLNELVEAAQQQNLTLQRAGTRILEARAVLSGVRGNFGPQEQAALGGLSHTHISHNSAGQAIASILQRNDFDQWTLGMGAAWEIDFWGRYRRAITAACADLDAARENRDDVSVMLLAETAQTYMQLRTTEHRLQLAKQNVSIQDETLQLTEARLRAGTGTELDVLQAKSNLRETQALVPALEGMHRITTNRLCILLGVPPRELSSKIGLTGSIPKSTTNLAIGVPADLLRRRPDVRRAERELAAQSERIGIATAEFYPHLSLSGNVGLDALDLSKLYSPRSWAAVAGPSFRWNILNYGRIKSGVQYQEARYQSLLLSYQETVLKADEEAENAIARYLTSQSRIALLESGVEAAQLSVKEALEAYRVGIMDYQRVFLLETQLVVKQDTLAVAHGELAQHLIAIYKAIGGGWQPVELVRLPNPSVESQIKPQARDNRTVAPENP